MSTLSTPLSEFPKQLQNVVVALRLKNVQRNRLEREGWTIVIASGRSVLCDKVWTIFNYHPIHLPQDDLWFLIKEKGYTIHGHY